MYEWWQILSSVCWCFLNKAIKIRISLLHFRERKWRRTLATRLPSAVYGSVKVAKGAYLKSELACITWRQARSERGARDTRDGERCLPGNLVFSPSRVSGAPHSLRACLRSLNNTKKKKKPPVMQAKPEPAGRANHFESKMLAFSRNFA